MIVVISGPPVEGPPSSKRWKLTARRRRSCQSHPIVGRSGCNRLRALAVGNDSTASVPLGGRQRQQWEVWDVSPSGL